MQTCQRIKLCPSGNLPCSQHKLSSTVLVHAKGTTLHSQLSPLLSHNNRTFLQCWKGSLELSIPTGYPDYNWIPATTQLLGTFKLAHACVTDPFGHHCEPPSWITKVIHPNTDLPLWVKVREWRRHGFSLKHQLYYSIYDVQWQKIMPIFILNLLYFISRECKLSAFPTWTTSHLLRFAVNALPNNIVICQRINFLLHVPSN